MTAALKLCPPPRRQAELHVAFPQKLSRALREEATRRGVRPNVLVGAAMQKLVDDSLFDAILDGEQAEDLAPGHAESLVGLTRIQGAVICLLAGHSDQFGIANISIASLATLIPRAPEGTVGQVLATLRDKGLIATAASPEIYTGKVPPRQLTEDGWAAARALGVVPS